MSKTSWKNITIPIVVVATIFAVFLIYWRTARDHERETLNLKTSLTAEQVAIRLENYIAVRLQVAASLGEKWGDHIDSYESYRNHAENTVASLGGLLALNWVDVEGVIRWVVPLEPNLAARGRDLMTNPVAGPVLRRVRETGKTMVTPPLDLYQGGRGVAAYIPIFTDGESRGYLNAVFRLAPMIEDCLERGVRENFFFVVAEQNELIYSSGDEASILNDPTRVSEHFRVGERKWTVTLTPTPRVAAAASTTLHDFIFGLGIVLALASGLLSWRFLEGRSRLKRSEARFRRIIDTAQEGIWTIDEDANTSFVNDRMAEMLGYTSDEMMGRSVYDFMGEDARHKASENVAKRDAGITEVHEFLLRRKDGTELWTIMSTNPMYDEKGEYMGALAMVSDITERKLAEQERRDIELQMRQAQKLESLGVLAGGIAHDFNNLLTGIIGNTGLVLDTEIEPDSMREIVEEIDGVAKRAAGLCQLMLTYAGKGQMEVEPVDFNWLVEEMGHLFGVSASKKATIEYELADGLPSVDADGTQIGQILMNLITNASEALGDETGKIVVRTGAMHCDRAFLRDSYLNPSLPEGRYVYLEVRDTGSGMDRETQDRIFDPFFTTKFVGRGLGLAAVMGIIRSHDGTIKVESAPGLGTTICVLLPAGRMDKAGTAAPGKTDSAVAPDVSGRTILAVDDEDIVLSLVERVLKSAGASVLTAANGHAAVEIFREKADEIDCVLLDLTMPEMNGDETLEELRRIREDVRVVISSGYAEEEVTPRFAGQSVGEFISKPFRPKEMIAALSRVLSAPE